MSSTDDKCRRDEAKRIIRNTAIAAATATGSLSQISFLGADIAFLSPLIINMVIQLGKLFDQTIDKQAATKFASMTAQYALGVFAAKSFIGLLPVVGNIALGAVTYPYIVSLGWTAYEIFESKKELSDISKDEILDYMSRYQSIQDDI